MTFKDRLVSIVVPAFNSGTTISETIASVLRQTFSDFELVVCDDASTDNTLKIVNDFNDKRIRLIRNAQNEGQGACRNRAVTASFGEWIAVLDADDAWHPRRLESLLEATGDDFGAIIFDDILECHHGRAGLIPWRRMRGEGAFGALDVPVDVSGPEWVCSRRLLIKPLVSAYALRNSGVTYSSRRFAEDTEFYLDLLHQGLKLRYVPEAYYYYRISPGSVSSIRSRNVQMREVLENAIILFDDEPSMAESLRNRLRVERRNEVYSEFLWSLKDRRLLEAMSSASAHPWVFADFFSRLTREIPYHAHRLWHHGSRRT